MNELEKFALYRLEKECTSNDVEMNHANADDILCDLLNKLGYSELVTEFKKIEKWYA